MYTPDNKEYVPVPDPNLAACKTSVSTQSLDQRIQNFSEVSLGYTPEEAIQEAARCLNCPRSYCVDFCPARVPIPQFIQAVRAGAFEEAYQLIHAKNNMPGATGRVCAQECQCESHCTRGIKGEPVAIGRLEAFVADWHHTHRKDSFKPSASLSPTSKRVAVVGSGPAGLTCAEVLASAGVRVTVFEARDVLGGAAAMGIPTFVLPEFVLEDKLSELQQLGVVFRLRSPICSVDSLLQEGYDAVFLAIGAVCPVQGGIPGEDLAGVWSASKFLFSFHNGNSFSAVEDAYVIGGGNTAVDAARCALRAGAKHVTILYRRSQLEMPAREEEVQRALEEGIQLKFLCQPIEFLGKGSKLSAIRCVHTELTAPDYPLGRNNIQLVPGTEEVLTGQLAILALGYQVDRTISVPRASNGCILVADSDGVSTPIPSVFAAGDAVAGPSTFVNAITGGRTAAQAILSQFSSR